MFSREGISEGSKEIAIYMMLAMKDIFYQFIGESSMETATLVLEILIRKPVNQYISSIY